ncbi:MAG TPA: D-alanyl-D-alanine carboxypeptidase/D-alanyl-D-alanine-endopeptidase [Chitinophagaceae bacterium]|jgi:D-alanyl-D-alanine carboxypeptidase/D-alanyl-D-alanine-endopeptidase (penicillin-binding protein 4)
MRCSALLLALLFPFCGIAQSITARLEKAYAVFENDTQVKHATISLLLVNAKNGQVLFARNPSVGMAPASTQKIVTAATALGMLGETFSYPTVLSYDGQIQKGVLKGNLYITGSGDPTLGSWRYPGSTDTAVVKKWVSVIGAAGIKRVEGDVIAIDTVFESQTTPGGWVWEDIGNYYGAGASGLNWHENQYDLELAPGDKPGEPVKILGTKPALHTTRFINELSTGENGSGDNGYIYLPPYSSGGFIRGTVPAGEKKFIISGALPLPGETAAQALVDGLSTANCIVTGHARSATIDRVSRGHLATVTLDRHESPNLDSIIYWFLQKSINLYGEALLKTFAWKLTGHGSADAGIQWVQDFWIKRGIDRDELNIKDGSGLAPQNRVTTHAQVEVLRYAMTQPWFAAYYTALPVFNNMKMKSGSIGDVKGFCGYQNLPDGTGCVFSFLVNNFSGSSKLLVDKMYKVLDVLK